MTRRDPTEEVGPRGETDGQMYCCDDDTDVVVDVKQCSSN
jgi:hypothetical protein